MGQPWQMSPSFMHRVVVTVLKLQGRKRRWADGAKLVETAREHNVHGPVAPPEWLSKRVMITTDTAAGFPVHTLRPLVESPGAKTVLYLHGGGFIHDFARQHWTFMTSLVEGSGATVIAAQYPLAPQHTWRDSAAPLIDLTLSSGKTAEYDAVDPWLATDGIRHVATAWAGGDDPASPEISPMFGSFEGLGRVLLFTGTRDILHPQARQLVRRLPSTQIVTERDLVHVYPLLPIAEAARALAIVEDFLRL